MTARLILKSVLAGTSLLVPLTYLAITRQEGQAYSWGFGRNGQLGVGSETSISLPQLIKNTTFVDIDAKKSISAGITADGKVFTWGKDINGILAQSNTKLNILIPSQVDFNDQITHVSCGYQHLCVVTQKGEAYVWGLQQKKSSFRTRGTSEEGKKEPKTQSTKIKIEKIIQASCANDYITFLNKDGDVFVMGNTLLKGVDGSQAKTKADIIQLKISNIQKISSGINFSMALTHDGKVYVWGNNTFGQLGTGGLKSSNEPILLESLSKDKIIDISCGDNYSGVVNENGEVYTWGFGNEGQLGHGDKSDQFLPRKINLKEEKVKAISCGGAHTALLTVSNKLLMMGRGREGQLGREQKDQSNSGYRLQAKEVEQLPQNRKIMKVVCGSSHTMVLMESLI